MISFSLEAFLGVVVLNVQSPTWYYYASREFIVLPNLILISLI